MCVCHRVAFFRVGREICTRESHAAVFLWRWCFSIIVVSVVCPTGPYPPLRLARRPNRGHIGGVSDAEPPSTVIAVSSLLSPPRRLNSWFVMCSVSCTCTYTWGGHRNSPPWTEEGSTCRSTAWTCSPWASCWSGCTRRASRRLWISEKEM